MKPFFLLLLALGMAGSLSAQTLSNLGPASPNPGANDISQLSTTGNVTGPDGLNYYTDNAAPAGQTFTTGSNPVTLVSVAIKTAGLYAGGGYGSAATAPTYYLRLYSMNGSTATLLNEFSAPNPGFTDGDWLKWTGLAVTLAANQTYAFSFGIKPANGGWAALAVATGAYPGGEIALIPLAGGAITTGTSHNFDAVFSLGLVPAFTIDAVTVLPATNVFVGTQMTFTASVTGAAPITYQWQFNDGSGFVDLPGTNSNTLSFSAAVAKTGSYRVVATNSSGTVTSAPVALSVTVDTTPPVVLRATNVGTTSVQVDFSKPLEAASAGDVANYSFSNGQPVTSVVILPGGTSVLLSTTTPLVYGSGYTVTVNGVRDQAVSPNTVAPNAATSFTATPGVRRLLDSDWRFHIGDPSDVTTAVTSYPEIGDLAKLQTSDLTGSGSENSLMASRPDPVATNAGGNVSYVQANYNDSAWRQLDLPHDWFVELGFTSSGSQNHGYKDTNGKTIAWYRHKIDLPSSSAGKVFRLELDGIFRNALIWVNGHCVGRSVSGYAPISFDVTPYLNPGATNVIVVRVDASRTEGWFYEGAGIYRHVWLVESDPVHVAHWGTQVATTNLNGSNATIVVKTDVTNDGAQTATGTLTSTIRDASNVAVAELSAPFNVAAGAHQVVTQTFTMDANLWSPQTPYLYNLVSTVSNQGAVTDIYNTSFGVRMVSWDGVNGVFINGKHVEIQGMCDHQDHAGVGTAMPDRLPYFRVERLKQMGVNACRTSHNPPTEAFLDACDRLGMLVLDETRRAGSDPESLGQLERMIRRDRNRACVFAWSLANEEWSIQGTSDGAAVMTAMQNLAHSLDSTRKCTAAINGSYGTSGFVTVLDVAGFNYNQGSITTTFHNTHPYIIGTEQGATTGSRGMYFDDDANTWLASYDKISTGAATAPNLGWTSTAESWWGTFAALPYASGAFNWTGFDYRGEPTPYNWPAISTQFGVMDTCGFPKDNFYYYQANWSLKPVLHILPHWNWAGKEGQSIPVWAYGNCQEVELFLNGVSKGRQTLDVRGHLKWDVPYAAGTLQAVGYTNGVAVLTDTVVTTGAPTAITLTPDRSTIFADGKDISIITVAAVDSQGRVVPTASNLVNFSISGGTIIGVGNGNPSSHESDKGSQRSVFNGLAQIIVQSDSQSGPISLTATSPGLTWTQLTITKALTMPPPAAPTNVAAVAGNAQVTVSWDIVHGATTYNLLRATSPGGPYTPIAANIGDVNLGYVDTSAANQTTYYYVVTANGAFDNGASANSTEVSAKPSLSPGQVPYGGTPWPVPGVIQAEDYDTGGQGVAYNDSDTVNSGGQYRSDGVDLETCAEGGYNVGWVGAGEWLEYTVNVPYTGSYGVTLRAASMSSQIQGHVEFDGVNVTGSMTAPATGGWQTYTNVTASNVTLTAGQHIMRVYFDGGGWNLNHITITANPLPAPQNVTATPGSAKITLAWNAVSGATDYTIRRASASSGPFTTLVSGITATTYANTGLGAGATWFYTVLANGSTGLGATSASVSATTYTAVENWRLANFGTTSNTGNAADSANPDGDSLLNSQEYVAGTDPNSGSSVLKIAQMQASGNDMVLSVPTVAGRTYRLERSDTLQNGSWTTVLTNGVPQDNLAGTGGTLQITDSGGAVVGKRFYRVVVW